MKRQTTILLTLLYLVFSTGFTMRVHYCGGEVSSISFAEGVKDCKSCGKKAMKGCCKDQTSSFQLDDDHNGNAVKQLNFSAPDDAKVIFTHFLYLLSDNSVAQIEKSFLNSNEPLASYKAPLFLRDCAFLI